MGIKEWSKECYRAFTSKWSRFHANYDYAFRWASEFGHKDVVKLLIQHGANIHANNDYAFRVASRKGHRNVVELLIENGANIHAGFVYYVFLV